MSAFAMPLQGCAFAYVDESGTRHVIGFVDIAIKPTQEKQLAGDIVEVSTVGISYLSDANSSSLALGYNQITSASFRDNAFAIGPFDHTAFETFGQTPSLDEK